MNREIKLRAWDGIRMTTSGIMFSTTSGKIEVPCAPSFNPTGANFDTYKVMQYTGLKDKEVKEIYESDLVEFYYKGENVICEIVFHNGCFKLKWRDGYINNHELNPSRYKVVGNIYENKELLNQ